jgi:hypothetical protein
LSSRRRGHGTGRTNARRRRSGGLARGRRDVCFLSRVAVGIRHVMEVEGRFGSLIEGVGNAVRIA